MGGRTHSLADEMDRAQTKRDEGIKLAMIGGHDPSPKASRQ